MVSLSYTFLLKDIVIIELFFISFGFLLRILAGGTGFNVTISGWFVLLTFFLSLLLAFGKRRIELSAVTEEIGFQKSPWKLQRSISGQRHIYFFHYVHHYLFTVSGLQRHGVDLIYGTARLLWRAAVHLPYQRKVKRRADGSASERHLATVLRRSVAGYHGILHIFF